MRERRLRARHKLPISSLIEARPEGVEPPTPGFEVRCSIQLSYGRVRKILSPNRIEHFADAIETGEQVRRFIAEAEADIAVEQEVIAGNN